MTKFFDFSQSKVLMIGGNSGLGLEMAKGFASANATVAICGRDQTKLDRAASEIGAKCLAWRADVSTEAGAKEIAALVDRHWSGTVNIVINGAGFNVRNLIQNISLEEWSSILQTNLTGAFLVARELYPKLRAAKFARLINLTSIFASVSYPERSSYAASKGGLLLLTKTLANEWAKDGITVNSISPGPFLTEINRKVLENPENYKKFCENIPMGRFGNPEEIVTTALYLASPYSSYVTGADVVIDGGWTAS